MSKGAKQVTVTCNVVDEGRQVEFFLMSMDGKKLTPQNIIDALGDYLIVDAAGIFSDNDDYDGFN